jgi:hypothetical protein
MAAAGGTHVPQHKLDLAQWLQRGVGGGVIVTLYHYKVQLVISL